MFHASPNFEAKSGGKSSSQLPPDERAFLDAAKKGDIAVLSDSLARGVPVDVREDFNMPWQQTALMYAAEGGHREAVQLLLKAGADIAAVDKDAGDSEGGNTALHHAVQGRNVPVMEDLLAAGADLNALTTARNTPLNHAIRENNPETFEVLLKHKPNLTSKINRKTAISPLCAAINSTWQKVPAEAIRDFILRLLEAGADPNGTGDCNRTALFGLVTARSIPNEIAIPLAEALLKAGAKVDHMEKDGSTPLVSAMCYENAPGVRLLLKHGADVNQIFPGRNLTALGVNQSDIERAQRRLADPKTTEFNRSHEERELKRYLKVRDMLLAAGAK